MGNSIAFDQGLAQRLVVLRQARNWSLDEAAEASGLSRATLSRIERSDTSPTARQLGQLCSAFGLTMSRLMGGLDERPAQHIARADQREWTDPETGFHRRQVSPPAAGFATEMIEGRLPAGAVIAYDAPPLAGIEQHIWMLDGELAFTDGDVVHNLSAGDTLRLHLWGRTRFEAVGANGAHYVVIITQGEGRHG